MTSESIQRQRDKYDREAEAYDRLHGDDIGQHYRTEFIRKRLFSIDMKGKAVLDAMSASGIETHWLISQGGDVCGLDISAENARLYKQNWDRDCRVASIHESGFPDASFDVVYIFGGLHHVIPIQREVMAEVHRVLRLGGHFCFVEPNKDTWLNRARDVWYKADKHFTDDESALSYKRDISQYLSIGFEEEDYFCGGNAAYLIGTQNAVLRMSNAVKGVIYPVALGVEKVFSFPGAPKLWFAARWRKVR